MTIIPSAPRESAATKTAFRDVWLTMFGEQRPEQHYRQTGLTWGQLRRIGLELFSAGCVHNAATRARLEELLPDEAQK